MNQTLLYLLETKGPILLNVSDESIFEECMDSCYFNKINFTNCSFEECELVGTNFNFCFFENCTFDKTIIQKSEVTDCVFKNCHFIESELAPKTNFYRTVFMDCNFSSIDFSFSFLSECEFVKVNLSQIKLKGILIRNLKTIESTTFNDLEFDEVYPMKISITDSSYFPKKI